MNTSELHSPPNQCPPPTGPAIPIGAFRWRWSLQLGVGFVRGMGFF